MSLARKRSKDLLSDIARQLQIASRAVGNSEHELFMQGKETGKCTLRPFKGVAAEKFCVGRHVRAYSLSTTATYICDRNLRERATVRDAGSRRKAAEAPAAPQ